MDMWNWLMDCYKDGSLTREELEAVMKDDKAARTMWEDWAADSGDFIGYVRDEIWPFIEWIKKTENDDV